MGVGGNCSCDGGEDRFIETSLCGLFCMGLKRGR